MLRHGPKGFEWRGIWASIAISENLPRRTGLSANAGPGTGLEWTPGGRGWEVEAKELGGRRDPHVLPLGYRATVRVAPPGCGAATPEVDPKKGQLWAKFARGF